MSGRGVLLRACAKINWTLEVLGRRPDGYHEIRSVLQTVALCDTVAVHAAPGPALTIAAAPGADLGPPEVNLAWRAAAAYPQSGPAAVRLRKRLPAAAGLGGGSSDAAAVLRGLDRLSSRPLGAPRLEEIGATLGSDVPFFVRGGTQLAAGRGERLRPLPDAPPAWLVLVTPPLAAGPKTARLFGLLGAADFGDGAATARLVRLLSAGRAPTAETLCNTFDRVADAAFPDLARYRQPLIEACGHALLCGAGPALFALVAGACEARTAAAHLRARGLPARAARTVAAGVATRARLLAASR